MNKNKVDFQIKAYLLLYRNFKKLHTFKIQKVVRNLKKDGKRKQELESENSDPQKITKVQLEIERLEKQKAKLDRVSKENLKMLTLHNLTTIYNFSLENYQTYFEKELPGYVAKLELFNDESKEEIQLIKWFEETIKDHKNYKETNEKLHFFSSQLEQIVEKNKIKRKTRQQNKKLKLKGKKGEDAEGDDENAEDKESENGNEDEEVKSENGGFEIEQLDGADGSESGEDIVLDDDDFEGEEDSKPKRNFQKQQPKNNKNNNNRGDKNNRNNNQRGRDKSYMRIEDSAQRRELNKERNKSKKRGEEFDLNKFNEAQKAKQEKYGGDANREPLKRDWKTSQDDRRGGRGGRGGSRGGRGDSRGGSRGGRGDSRGGRDNYEPDVRKKFQGEGRQDFGRQDFRSQDKKENKFKFDELHPSWKARIEQKQGATIATFQGTKEKL